MDEEQKIIFIEKATKVIEKSRIFIDDLKEWSDYIMSLDRNKLSEATDSDDRLIAIADIMGNISIEIENLL